MRLLSFKPLVKGSHRGFGHVELPSGLRIADVPVLMSHGKAWATLPSKPVLGADGKHVVAAGKKQYAPVLEWRDRQLTDGFSAAVVELVSASYPDALKPSAGTQSGNGAVDSSGPKREWLAP